jgi:hypothetical protein
LFRESYTTSLKSSITNYKYENGRRYHAFKDGSYFLPNDESEADRLDLFHHIMSLRMNGELHWAPIGDNPQRILDIGTGTGIWAIDMGTRARPVHLKEDFSLTLDPGDKYPSAEILGNDLSAIQPSLYISPSNTGEIAD